MKKALFLILIVLIASTFASCDMGGFDPDDKKPGSDHVHSFGDWETIVSPTCKVEGSKVRYCECGAKEEETIYSTGHTEVIDAAVDATCTTDGLTKGSHCSKCGEIFLDQKPIPARHTEVIDAAVAPTCTTSGLSEGSHCSVCGEVLVEPRPVPPSHTVIVDAAVAPTCTTNGKTEGKHCSACSEILVAQTTVDALGHIEVVDAAVAPTCTKTGLTEGSHCSTCNEIFVSQSTVAAKGHVESEATIENNVAPTCVVGGSYDSVVYCEICDMELSRDKITVNPLGHTEVTDEAVAPTCTKTGLTAGSHCSVCNKVLVKQTAVNKISHEYVDYVCSECGAKLTPTSNSYFKFTELSDGTYSVGAKDKNNIPSTIIIPNTYNSIAVTSISKYAFSDCSNLKDVTIPDSVTIIDQGAFANCSELSSIIIPNGVSTISANAFSDSSKLESIIIPDGVSIIGYNAFYNTAYYNNNGNWTEGVLYIGNHLIKAGKMSFGEYIIRDGTATIASYAFYDCNTVTYVTIPESVSRIGEYAFKRCSELERVSIPCSVINVDRGAFDSCNNLNRVDISDLNAWCNISFSNAFSNPLYYANKLYLDGEVITDLEFTDGINKISNYAFCNYKTLQTITIPDGFTNISENAFSGCQIEKATIPTSAISCIPKESLHTVVITSGNSIGSNAFKDSTRLKSITISDSVTSISNSAFSGCPIESAAISSSLISYIPKDSLKTLVITSGSAIDNYALDNCGALKSVTIPASITEIGYGAFRNCNVTRVDISDLVTWCGITFYNQYSNPLRGSGLLYLNGELITTLVIPDDITEIKDRAFYGCESITNVTIHQGVTSIGERAFADCVNLTAVTIPSSVEYIGSYAFASGLDLSEVVILGDDTEIGAHAFDHCHIVNASIPTSAISHIPKELLQTLVITSGTSIPKEAFEYCNTLTSVTIADSVTDIGYEAFAHCDNLSSVVVPKGLMTLSNTSFAWCNLDTITGGNEK